MYDILILGAGITGTLTARTLSQYALKTAVLEKGNDIAAGATMANSAIVHTGYDPEDNTLKAKLNVEGARMYPQLLEDLHCTYKKVGAWIVAKDTEGEKKLEVLADRAQKRGIEHAYVDLKEAFEQEKNLSPEITKVLSFPTTLVIYPWLVATCAMENAMENGVELYLNHEVTKIEKQEDCYVVHTSNGTFTTKMIINCTGTHCASLSTQVSDRVTYQSKPKKGEYFVLDQGCDFVHHIIFPVPTAKGKGVLAVPTVYGNVLLGPGSEYVEDNDDVSTSSSGLSYVRSQLANTLVNVPYNKVIRSFTGLRPSTTSKDFVITEYEDAAGFVDVASVESPGLASAPAIACYVADTFVSRHFDLHKKEDYQSSIPSRIVMNDLSQKERNAWIAKKPAYGKIICRCENISEQEIVDAIHSPIPCTTIKAIKKRVRPGMGKCQGGFCEPLVTKILARELGIKETEVLYDTPGSNILEKENRS